MLLSSNRINKLHIFVFIAFYKISQLVWGYEVMGLIKINSCDLLYSQSASWSYNTSSRSPFRRAPTMQHLKIWRKISLLYQAAAARVLILVCCHFVYVTNSNLYLCPVLIVSLLIFICDMLFLGIFSMKMKIEWR